MERNQGGAPGRQSRTRPAHPRHEDVAEQIVRNQGGSPGRQSRTRPAHPRHVDVAEQVERNQGGSPSRQSRTRPAHPRHEDVAEQMERNQGGSPGRQSRTRPAHPRHEDVAEQIVRRPLRRAAPLAGDPVLVEARAGRSSMSTTTTLRGRLLVVEDERIIRTELRRLLVRAGYEVTEAETLGDAREYDLGGFDLILADLRLPGGHGTELIREAPEVPVVVMTSYATVRSAIDAMKLGAVDYLSKPFDDDELLMLVDRVLREGRLARTNKALRLDVERFATTHLVGDSPPMREVLAHVARVAPTSALVLVRGESGTGKELVARAVHDASPRAEGPFVAVNCAALPEGLLESELFGHERGAFTGAGAEHHGLVETAHGGTLFLDEIGELPLGAQARLLRLIQESEIRRVGATRVRKVDVRLVAATHRNLEAMVAAGEFRDDLYYRLRVFEIHLPPLRERPEDLPQLADVLLARACDRVGRSGLWLGPAALAAIRAHSWPGNVRELENAIERAVILADAGELPPRLLAVAPAPSTQAGAAPVASGTTTPAARATPVPSTPPGDDSLVDYFRRFVLEHQDTLSETEMARRLGISRKALWERRARLGIPRPR
jgi:DNA-binding NtrC family response regulator